MKRFLPAISIAIIAVISFVGTLALLVTFAGCSADSAGRVQGITEDVAYAAGAPSTRPAATQPSALDTTRAVVQDVGLAVPQVATIAGLVAGVAGLVGNVLGKKSANSVVSEIVSDAAGW